MDYKEILDTIIDKIDNVIYDYKHDRDFSAETRTWTVCALAEVKQYVKSLL